MDKEHSTDKQKTRKALRERAEEAMRTSRADVAAMPAEDIQALVHELQVHQVELEIQNEELREAQAKLAESRDRYADLYEFAPVGYLTLGEHGAILEANLAAAEMLGTDRGALLQAKITSFIASASQDTFYLHQQAVDEDENKQVCELEMQSSEGPPVIVRLESIKHMQAQHAEAFCRTAMIDVTAQRKAEQELRALNAHLDQRVRDRTAELFQTIGNLQEEVVARREAEERLRREAELTEGLDETTQAVILTLDREGKILHINRYMEQLSGHTNDEMWGHDWFDTFLLPEDRTEIRELFQNAISGERTFRTIGAIVTKTGEIRQIEWSDAALTDRDGTVIGLVCTGHDVTDRIELEMRLRETTENLQAILNTAVDAIITIDPRGRIVSANPATQQMFGYTQEELVGHNVSMLMGSPHHEQHDDYLANYMRTGQAKIIGSGREVMARRKDDSTFPVDLVISQFHDRRGKMFTGVMRDISKRKELERHMAESREEERRHLSQEVHDGLGGQMTGVRLLAKSLQNQLQQQGSPFTEAVAELASHIRNAHEQLRAIARGLQPVEVTPDGLEAALGQLAALTSEQSGVVCVFRSLGSVSVSSPSHAVHLYRIAQEAVSNALRHASPEAITIDLAAEHGHLRLVVRDDGNGIQQSSDSSQGMGLRTMQYRANQIGATITVEPADEGGTEVCCVYPNQDDHDQER